MTGCYRRDARRSHSCAASRSSIAISSTSARRSSRLPTISKRSKRADRKIAQPEVRESPQLPHAEQRKIEHEPHRIVAASHGDPDALTEMAAVEIGPAAEGA